MSDLSGMVTPMPNPETSSTPAAAGSNHQLDDGRPIALRGRKGARELELRVDMQCCARAGCECTTLYLELSREGRPGSAIVIYDAATGAVTRVHDPQRISGNEGALRLRLGELRELFARRLARTRAQRDPYEWRGYDWQAHAVERPVPFERVFPSAWNLSVVHDGCRWWIFDQHCVRPGCTCGAIELELRDEEGRLAGAAVVTVAGAKVRVSRCDAASDGLVRALLQSPIAEALVLRAGAMARVARRLETWLDDLADPAPAVRAAVALESADHEDAWERVQVLGERAVPALQAVLAAAPDERLPWPALAAAALLVHAGDGFALERLARALIEHNRAARSGDTVLIGDDDMDLAWDALGHAEERAIGPIVAVLNRTDAEGRMAARWALVSLVLRTDEIRAHLVGALTEDVRTAAELLKQYGDPAVTAEIEAELVRRLDAQELDPDALEALTEAIEDLGGDLSAPVAARLREHRLRKAIGHGARAEPAKRPQPGRNEPCWCGSGSGKKYKRCHLGSEG